MSQVTEQEILKSLGKVIDPVSGGDIVSGGMVIGLQIKDGHVAFSIEVDPDKGSQMEPLRKEAEKTVHALPGVLTATVVLTAERAPGNDTAEPAQAKRQAPPPDPAKFGGQPLEGVSSIVAVASGKGGVGKSTTAVNIALAMAASGHKVGLLDADIYGPSMPRMLGISGQPASTDGKILEPMQNFGLKVMSIGFLVEEDTPMIWRGPMVTGALEQLLNDTNWKDVDYLVIDLPPGTGDIHLTLCQKIPVSGAVIVTTPQDIALLDARKALKMFEKVEVPVLGIIENMSVHICTSCGHEDHIFGTGGGESMAQQYGVDLLGALPLDTAIRKGMDSGKPIVALQPDSRPSQMYCEIARRIAGKLGLRAKDYSAKFPKIVVQNN